MLPADFLDDLHRQNDIVEVVAQDTEIKKKGRTYSGLCPFHNEKTPSFHVYPETQSFYCFGCGKGGDVITYVMEHERLSYIEAVRLLAQRAGLAIPADADDKLARQRVNILAANKAAARFFYEALNTEAGKNARAYLRSRGLSDNTIKRFGIGYAPDSWAALTASLREQNFYPDDIVAAGLCGRGQRGLYDRFRNRLMFPIIDLRGNVVGFGGRRLNENDKAKYINTNETPVYKKSWVVYALNVAKAAQSRTLILVEGYMDVISLHQAGFNNAVATLGTAMSEGHAKLMSQYADEIVISYDSDGPGQAALQRAMQVLKATDLRVRVLQIPDAKDPDEYIKKNGALAFEQLLEGSGSGTEYELAHAKKGLNLDADADRVEYLKRAAQILSKLASSTETEIYAGRVASETGVSKSSIMTQTEFVRKKRRDREQAKKQKDLTAAIGQELRSLKAQGDAEPVQVYAAYQLLAVLCRNPDYCAGVEKVLSAAQMPDAQLSQVYALLQELSAQGSFSGFASLGQQMPEQVRSTLAHFLARTEGANFTQQDALYLAEKVTSVPPSLQQKEEMTPEQLMELLDKT